MTRQRNDDCSTEFGLWLRNQLEPKRIVDLIDSKIGFTAYNVDYIWRNYKSGNFMLLEEKRYNSSLIKDNNPHSVDSFLILDNYLSNTPKIFKDMYKGFHFLQFENTNPEDGWTKLDGKMISKEDLIKFLRFEIDEKYYKSYIKFDK